MLPMEIFSITRSGQMPQRAAATRPPPPTSPGPPRPSGGRAAKGQHPNRLVRLPGQVATNDAGYRGCRARAAIALAPMNTTAPPAGDLYLVDTSGMTSLRQPGAGRRGQAAAWPDRPHRGGVRRSPAQHRHAVGRRRGRNGSQLRRCRAGAAHKAGERLGGREERWGFEWRQGLIADELIATAEGIREAHASDNVVIVVGSSSHAMHRVVGSVAVTLRTTHRCLSWSCLRAPW